MTDSPSGHDQDLDAEHIAERLEYVLVWRYGPILLILAGLAMIACGLAGATSVSPDTLLPVGFAMMLSGVLIPRIGGKFSASPTRGVEAELFPVHKLDARVPRFAYSGPATTATTVTTSDDGLPPLLEPDDDLPPPQDPADEDSPSGFDAAGPLTISDVMVALEDSGYSPEVSHTLHQWVIKYEGPRGATLKLRYSATSPEGIESPVNPALVEVVRGWGVPVMRAPTRPRFRT